MKRMLIVMICLLAFAKARAQQYPRHLIDLDQHLEEYFPIQNSDDESLDRAELMELLYQRYASPLDLNQATKHDLASLMMLSPAQIEAFLEHRQRVGDLLSVYELQSIPLFDLPTIYKILPFVVVRELASNLPLLQRILQEDNNYLVLRYERLLEQQKGFKPPLDSSNNFYQGSPFKTFLRFKTSKRHDFSLGFTLEKDAGETIAWTPSQGKHLADFFSFHLFLENKGRFKSIAIGDYQLQIGQGLLFASGFNIGKGSETIKSTRRTTVGLRPYASSMEFGYLRGMAGTYRLLENPQQMLDLTVFLSHQGIDASLSGDSLITTIRQSGFHRTQSEIRSAKSSHRSVVGSHVSFSKGKLDLGMTAVHTHLGKPLHRRPSVYNQYEFAGQDNHNVGVDYAYQWYNLNIYGEVARSQSGGIGMNTGLLLNLSQQMSMAIQYRSFDRDFHSFYGGAFGESSRNINERGIYLGINYQHGRRWAFDAFFDQFWHPWRRYLADAPSRGHEYLLRLTHSPSRQLSVYVQYRNEVKELNHPNNTTRVDFLSERHRRLYLFQLSYKPSRTLSIKSRIQYSDYQHGDLYSKGFAIIQDLNCKVGRRFKVGSRLAIFDTDDYYNRQYAYEKDVMYTFSIPALFYKGSRSMLLLSYKANKKLTFWLKYAITKYKNRDHVGSGLDRIEGNRKRQIKIQVRYKF